MVDNKVINMWIIAHVDGYTCGLLHMWIVTHVNLYCRCIFVYIIHVYIYIYIYIYLLISYSKYTYNINNKDILLSTIRSTSGLAAAQWCRYTRLDLFVLYSYYAFYILIIIVRCSSVDLTYVEDVQKIYTFFV